MIHFLTENRLKDFTTVLGNVDINLISPLMITVSDMWIKPRLGSYFYNDILVKYNAQTLDPLETELVSIIQNAMLWRLAADISLTASYQTTNKGIQTQNGMNSNNATLGEVSLISKHYTQKAEFYDARLVNHLTINKATFPNFTDRLNTGCNIVDIAPSAKKSYNMDITFM